LVATADEASQTQSVSAFDRETGEAAWTAALHRGGFMNLHQKNSQASATPACDGRLAFTAMISSDALWVSALDLADQGRIVWQTEAGPFESQHGYGSSPVIYKSLVIVAGDNNGPGYLAALHRQTGKIVWRVQRTEQPSYGTPTVARLAGRDQLLVSGCDQVAAYDPQTGELIWYCDGPSQVTAGTMAFGGGLVFASGGYPEKELLCIRPDGMGDVTDTHVVWLTREGVAYVPSPLYRDGRLFVVSDGGIATCFDGAFSSSPTLAGGNIYVSSEEGTTFVFRAADEFEEVAQNELEGGQMATPAVCGDRIYLRTSKYLYALGEENRATAGRRLTAR
jgi:hypothetical protein